MQNIFIILPSWLLWGRYFAASPSSAASPEWLFISGTYTVGTQAVISKPKSSCVPLWDPAGAAQEPHTASDCIKGLRANSHKCGKGDFLVPIQCFKLGNTLVILIFKNWDVLFFLLRKLENMTMILKIVIHRFVKQYLNMWEWGYWRK